MPPERVESLARVTRAALRIQSEAGVSGYDGRIREFERAVRADERIRVALIRKGRRHADR